MADYPIPLVDTSWRGVYEHRFESFQNAPTPELREHFRRELEVMDPTMRALGLDVRDHGPGPISLVSTGPPPPPPVAFLTTDPPRVANPPPTSGGSLALNLPPELEHLRRWIEDAASRTGVPANLIAAVIWQESRGLITATSVNGGNGLTDVGLMQINPHTFELIRSRHPDVGPNASDPANNILAAAYYLKDLKAEFGSWELTLRAYNSGENGVNRSDPNATPAGTGDPTYVVKVMKFWEILETGQGTLPA